MRHWAQITPKDIRPLLSRIPHDTGHWQPIPLSQRKNFALLEMNLMPSISVKTPPKALQKLWPSVKRFAFVWLYLVKHFSSKFRTHKIGPTDHLGNQKSVYSLNRDSGDSSNRGDGALVRVSGAKVSENPELQWVLGWVSGKISGKK